MTTAGALTLTWIEVDEAWQDELIARTTDMITAGASDPALVGFPSTAVGRRNLTLTAWTCPTAAEAAVARNRPAPATAARSTPCCRTSEAVNAGEGGRRA